MEIVVASGKGGTGKTFIASNLTLFFEKNLGGAVAVDADVEAPDLALALGGEKNVLWKKDVWESARAVVNYDLCDGCGECLDVCMFDAITTSKDGKPSIAEEFCEGCGACSIVCPRKAIRIEPVLTGWILGLETESGVYVVMGDLEVGGRNTGHVVYLARNEAKKMASEKRKSHVIVDAAPGIGCPVISSVSGSDLLIIVVEPTPQSLQGAKRVLKVAEAFNVQSYCILNKYDLNPSFSEKIPEKLGVKMIGKIPYDEEVAESYTMMKPIISEPGDSAVKSALREVFENLLEELEEAGKLWRK